MSLDRPNQFVQSRCPNCDTLYHIDQETLAEADGRARCFRCGTVFDALAQQPEVAPAPANGEEPEIGAELELTRLVESLEERAEDGPGESVPVRLASALATERSERQPRTQTDPSDQPRAGATPPSAEPSPPPGASAPPPPFEVPDDLPELQPTTEPAGGRPARRRKSRLLPRLVKTALVLLLALAGLVQWLWYQPQYLGPLQPYYARLQAWCAQQGCPIDLPPLPMRRSPEDFAILQREIAPVEGSPGVLRLSLTFVNGADFAQPYPEVLVLLLDNRGATVAERRVRPSDYLDSRPRAKRLLEPQQVISFDLMIEDPGETATGFKLKFL